MARPLWLKLLGSNGATGFADLRDALLASPLGDRLGESRLFQQLERIVDRGEAPARTASIPILVAADPRAQASLAAAVAAEHDLAALNPAAAPTPATDAETPPPAVETAAIVTPPAEEIVGDTSEPSQILHINGIVSPAVATPLNRLDTTSPYAVIGDFETGLVVDTRNRTLMQGGPGDYPELLAGAHDILELRGDYSTGWALAVPAGVEQVMVHAGNDYNLIADDNTVVAGTRLTINAMPLGDANYIMFDGSAETDGSFLFHGSDAGDVFIGGAGDDVIYGLGGGDILSGGGGSDTFVYYDAAHSSGAGYDVLADFDPATDKLDLQVTVSGFDSAIDTGTLSEASFDTDLAAALAGLGAGKAVYYAPDEGDLAGTVFLVVDANGVAGYQEGEDYVFALAGATLEDLSGNTGFFI